MISSDEDDSTPNLTNHPLHSPARVRISPDLGQPRDLGLYEKVKRSRPRVELDTRSNKLTKRYSTICLASTQSPPPPLASQARVSHEQAEIVEDSNQINESSSNVQNSPFSTPNRTYYRPAHKLFSPFNSKTALPPVIAPTKDVSVPDVQSFNIDNFPVNGIDIESESGSIDQVPHKTNPMEMSAPSLHKTTPSIQPDNGETRLQTHQTHQTHSAATKPDANLDFDFFSLFFPPDTINLPSRENTESVFSKQTQISS